jgi:GNAT superfamily N-acetyltransferase
MQELPVLRYRWLASASMVEQRLSTQLAECWRDVSNSGGAVGFPFLPVADAEVAEAVDRLVASLEPPLYRLLVAMVDETLAGWLVLAGNSTRLTAHWARVLRVQSALPFRGAGVGRGLMAEVARAARDDFGLEQLHLELRGGQGLEGFYESCGWREAGRWPAALRLHPDDDRDEVLMLLRL